MRALLLTVLLVPVLAQAAGAAGVPLRDAGVDLRDVPSLQRGARLYVDYCLACHSLRFQRYERTADDLRIPHDVALETLVPAGGRIGDLITSAIPPKSKDWFGGPPPDLTMVARVRSPDWLFTYLTSFYLDPARPFGVNNALFANVGMPHVLLGLQGRVVKGCAQVPAVDARGAELRDPLVPGRAVTEEKCTVSPHEADGLRQRGIPVACDATSGQCDLLVHEAGSGKLAPAEFDAVARDIVNFLYYVGEPMRLDRERIGVYVLLFLVVLFVLAWLLNREYWKDVH
jgi:cytochrome c1